MKNQICQHSKVLHQSISILILLLLCLSTYASSYYWVGDAGNWSDYAAHWATTSGGDTFHSQIPT